MRVAIDASAVVRAKRTGVANYTANVIENLAAVDPETDFILCYRLSRWKRRQYFLETTAPNLSRGVIAPGLGWLSQRGVQVFHGPDARLPEAGRAAMVVTFHDVFSLVSDEWATPKFRAKKLERYRQAIARADKIIAVSECTKQDILRFLEVDAKKIDVVYCGVNDGFCRRSDEEIEAVRAKYGLAGPYVLYVGQLATRKNIVRLLEALTQILDHVGPDRLTALLTGDVSFGEDAIGKALKEFKHPKSLVLPGHVETADLPALYSGAELFLFPTLYEGFGLPVIEAMACGAPVLTSNVSALPEVGGDVALLVDPEDTDAIAAEAVRILEDSALRADLRIRGVERAREFTWRKTAEETLAVYRSVATF
jgi:glycosyltransferase involved in cell wall biosynthesis